MKPSSRAATRPGPSSSASAEPCTGGSLRDHKPARGAEDLELELFLEALYQHYGYDFRNYARAHVQRRIMNRTKALGLTGISELQGRALHDRELVKQLLLDLSISVTEMFRDPGCYITLRREVIPVLKTYPFVKIWHAGCATGEEVYSLAILLKEEGLYDRCQIYATDFNQAVLRQAQDGIYPAQAVREYTANYQRAGGTGHFSDYYTADYGSAILDRSLKDRIVFAEHNLVTDGVFGDMHLILCRNVLIYFNRSLQNQVIGLFHRSLCPGGFLCLGSKETLRFTDYLRSFEVVSAHDRIFRKYLQPVGPPSDRQPA